jgi:hypothetical protein
VSLTPLGLLVFAVGPFLGVTGTLYFFLILALFGAGAAVELGGLNASATPVTVFVPFLLWRAFRSRQRTPLLRRVPKSAVWLGALVTWAVAGAFVIPRALAGQVEILTLDRSSALFEVALYPLGPVSGNITQACYALCDFCVFLAFGELLAAPGRIFQFRSAVLVLALLDCVAAVINLLEYYAGLPAILHYVRNGNYQIYDSYELGGLVRIQGTFAEASHFANFTLPLFAFCFATWLYAPRPPRYAGVLAALLLLFLIASTSSTAYLGLALYLACVGGRRAAALLSRGLVPRVRMAAVLLGALLLVAAGVALLDAHLLARLTDYLDSVLFRKLQTSSGEDRMALNRQAWQNFVDTWGLGVGLGTARASSFPLVLLSNLGVIGALLFGGFLRSVARARTSLEPEAAAVSRAARHALLAGLASAVASGFVFDLGVVFYACAAAACVTAPAWARAAERARSPVPLVAASLVLGFLLLRPAPAAAETLGALSAVAPAQCWQLSRGTEFPGAGGALELTGTERARALEVRYDFSRGGKYVAAVCELTEPRAFRYLKLRAVAPDGVHVRVRVRDESGQWLQYRVERPLGALDPTAPFRSTLALANAESHWSGAGDGRLHGAIHAVALGVEDAEPHASGSVRFDELGIAGELTVALDPRGAARASATPGTGTALFDGLGVALHDLDDTAALDAAKSAGFSWVRADLFWDRVEHERAKYDFAAADRFVAALEARGMRPLFILGMRHPGYGAGPPLAAAANTAFVAFARAAARHFAGHGARYEIGNEPNIARFWPPRPDARAAAKLELEGERAVHAGDPKALVVTGGLSWFELPFLAAFVAAGGTLDAQAVGVHPYRGVRAPESLTDDLVDARRVLREHGARNLPIWDTEWGYSSAQFGDGHAPAARRRQALFAVRRLLASRLSGLPLGVWYDLRDDGPDAADAEQNFGLLASDGSPKPALVALRALHAVARDRVLAGTLELAGPLVNGLALDGPRDRVVVLWTANGESVSVRTPRPSAASDLFGTTLPLAGSYTLDEERGPIVLTFPAAPEQRLASPAEPRVSGVGSALRHPLDSRGCACGVPRSVPRSGLLFWWAPALGAWRRRRASPSLAGPGS